MDIQPAEISAILKREIQNFGAEAEVSEVGQVLSVGDGIARVYGLDNGPGRRDGRVPRRHPRHGAQPRERQCRRRDLRQRLHHQGRRHRQAHQVDRGRARGPRPARPRRRPAGQSHRRSRRSHQRRRAPPRRRQGARHHPAQVRARAGADRPQGHRHADPDRPRPARADHRRTARPARPPSPSTRSSTRRPSTPAPTRRPSCTASTSPSARSAPPSRRSSRRSPTPARSNTRSS